MMGLNKMETKSTPDIVYMLNSCPIYDKIRQLALFERSGTWNGTFAGFSRRYAMAETKREGAEVESNCMKA
jgi:hypothetical protein